MVSVKVYSTESCPWCKKLKEFLKENKVSFTEIDVGADENAAKKMMEESGQSGVPVTNIDGQIIVGFDKEKLKELLKLK